VIFCRIQAAQAAAAPSSASAATPAAAPAVTPAAPSPPTEELPPLPPLPPPEEDGHPPPPPPETTAEHSPPEFCLGMHSNQQTGWGDPASSHRSESGSQWSAPNSALDTAGWQGRATASITPAADTKQTGANHRGARTSATPAWQGKAHPAGIQIKTEPGTDPNTTAAVKSEVASTTARNGASSHAHIRQEAQPSGAIQFGFGGRGKAAGKVNILENVITADSWTCCYRVLLLLSEQTVILKLTTTRA